MAEETRNAVTGPARVGSLIQAGRVDALHQHFHLAPPPGPIPRQLPVTGAHFEDREEERRRVLAAVAGRCGDADPARPRIVVLSGVGGIGKTTLGLRLAHELAPRYPDGALYVDLDECRSDGAADISQALALLLGGHDEWLPAGLAGRRAQYRERTAGLRLLVVVDNARYEAETEPLLPASPHALVIVTSHARLPGLEADDAVSVPLGPLKPEHSMALLRRVAGDARLSADPAAADELVRICGGLPAALRVAGQWMRAHSRWRLPRLVAELRAELNQKGLPVVEAVWDAAYRGLSARAARLYRLLAEHPAAHFPPESAAAALGEGQDAADDALDELERASLLEVRLDGHLYLHGLLRAHARRRARAAGDAAEARQAARRVVRWYRRQAERADELVAGPRMRLATAVEELPYAPDVAFDGGADGARRWLEHERVALYGCVRLAFAHGEDTEAWSLCEPLWTHFMNHRHYADAIDVFRIGVEAAGRDGHPAAQVRMRCQLARPLWETGQFDEAGHEVRAAERTVSALPDADPRLLPSVLEFGGRLRAEQGDWEDAAAAFERARRLHADAGNGYGVLLQTHLLGQAAARLGQHRRAAALLEEVRERAAKEGRTRLAGRAAHELGLALAALGDAGQAKERLTEALVNARRRGSGYDEARAREALAALAESLGDAGEAAEHRAAARALQARAGALPQPPHPSPGASPGVSPGDVPPAASES